jgi:hypothetical protein
VQRGDDVPAQVRLLAPQARHVPHLETADAAPCPLVEELLEVGDVGVVEGHGQVADALEAERQIARELAPELVAAPLGGRLDGAVDGAVAAVDDAAVRLARPQPTSTSRSISATRSR